MSPEEALGRVARAKENMVIAQKNLKELWADWIVRNVYTKGTKVFLQHDFSEGCSPVFSPTGHLDRIIERLELVLTDIKTVRDNLKMASQ